jgi:anti-anti-sigma factor
VNPYTSSATYYSSCRLARAGPGAETSVVWLGGDHDIATKDVLVAVLAEAVALDEPAVIIDMSGVHFISATTIGAIVGAKNELARRGRPLVLRGPPPFVRRVFDACGMSGLLEGDPGADSFDAAQGASALGSWVDVPATARGDGHESDTSEPKGAEQVSVESAPGEQVSIVRIP